MAEILNWRGEKWHPLDEFFSHMTTVEQREDMILHFNSFAGPDRRAELIDLMNRISQEKLISHEFDNSPDN